MSWIAFLLIFASAVMHASWNMIAKKDHMSLAFYAVICSFGCIAWCHVPFWTPIAISQLPAGFWFCVAGTVSCDLFYGTALSFTYRKMDMVTAYPLVRAIPILLTALITTVLGLGNALTWLAKLGFMIVFAGALLMPLAKFSDFSLKRYWNPALLLVLLTACGTTGYTIFDSQAQKFVRAAGAGVSAPVISLTYYSLRALCLASSLWLVSMCFASQRGVIAQLWKSRNWHPIVAGACGSLTYVLVLIAMNFVTNVSFVQVFRQLGLPVGMLAGIFILHEKSSPVKWCGVVLILLGLAISVLK